MSKFVRQSALAAGFVALGLASTASHAASATYEFKTFFDTSTSDPLDTKTLAYSVASLELRDITGGVELTLTQNNTAFPSKSGGTFVDALYLAGPNGSLKLNSRDQFLNWGSGYNSRSFTKDGYTYQWNVDFGGFSEGESAKLTILGTGVSVAKFGATPMLDIDNAGKPYATGFLGLSDNVHFVGKLAPAVPEPSTYAMLGLGLAGVAFVARRRKSA